MTAARGAAALLLLAGWALGAGPVAAQAGGEPADTAAADTLEAPADTTEAAGDTIEAPADTTAAGDTVDEIPSPSQMRQELAGGAFPARDSVFREMTGLSGYRTVEYRGRRVVLEVPDRTIRLRDSAQVNYGEAALRGDSVVYRARLQFVSARGDIVLASPGERQMTTDSVLYYDVSRLKGTVLDARTSFAQQGVTWNVRGDAVPVGQETVYVNRGQFSSCNRETPHYWFQAGQIKMVNRDVIVAWPVTFYVSEVPVFWLPFFAQDIRPERRSGILPPQFGFNDVIATSDGFQRQISDVGYYWAINRFMDARTTVDWWSGQFTRVNADFRYHFMKKFIEGSVGISQEWGQSGKNLRLDVDHEQRVTPDTRLTADAEFVQSERLLRDRSVDPREQTQTIDTNVGIRHDLDFADLQVSAERRQFLGQDGKVNSTLPSASVSFSPVTLFEAPRTRAGPFNNLTWRSSASFQRQQETQERANDVLTTTGNVSQSLSLGRLSVSTNGSFNQQATDRLRVVTSGDPEAPDSTFVELPTASRTTTDWNTSADFQVSLMGSTTLRPTVNLSGGWFRSDVPIDTIRGDTVRDTDGRFVTVPTRYSVGASLSSDVFGFFPGFGPFSQIRHKISPRFQWRYSPEVTLSDTTLSQIQGFPGGTGQTRNELSVSLNQTFEAKMPEETGEEAAPGDTAGAVADTAAADTAGAADTGDGLGRGTDGGTAERAPAAAQRERKVTVLAIRSDALQFDFERAEAGEPLLTTDRWGNSVSSDLLRGLSLNVTHDLFEGQGQDRELRPFLSQVNASFSLSSGTSLGDIFGLGPGSGRARPRRRPSSGRFGGRRDTDTDGAQGRTGTWDLSLSYSLNRSRDTGDDGGGGLGGTGDSQTLSWNLNLQPTPNWRMNWDTSYNVSDNEFGSHRVSLVRNLHRWRARFEFLKAPNGNFVFQFLVQLTDAPDLKVNYDQRSEPPQ